MKDQDPGERGLSEAAAREVARAWDELVGGSSDYAIEAAKDPKGVEYINVTIGSPTSKDTPLGWTTNH